MIKVLIAEDMNVVRGALVALLSLERDLAVVASVERGDEVMAAASRTRPDVAVLDIDLPGVDGLTVAERMADELPECRVVVLTAFGNPGNLQRALAGSVRGFVVKDAPAEQLANTVRRVADGEVVVAPELIAAAVGKGRNPLTTRERQLLRGIATGATVAEVATSLEIGVGTSRNYISNAIAKLHARNRTDAIRIAREMGWI